MGDDIKVHFVSLEKVGTDVEEMFTPRYTTAPLISGANGRKPQVCGESYPHVIINMLMELLALYYCYETHTCLTVIVLWYNTIILCTCSRVGVSQQPSHMT